MPKILEVAAGVVIRADGQVLLAQRPPGKAYEGWWEFPGGKIEAGESPAQALARELGEELGLDIAASHPWLVREHVYPHAHVRLHFRRVFGGWGDYRGDPRSNEGQAFAWHPVAGAGAQPLLPASVAVFRWLRWPLVLPTWRPDAGAPPVDANTADIDPGGRAREAQVLADAHLPDLLGASVPIWLLELPSSSPAARGMAVPHLDAWQDRIRAVCVHLRTLGGCLLVPSSAGEALVALSGAVLLTSETLAGLSQRPAPAICAALCRTPADLSKADALGLDFALLAPGLDPVLPGGRAAALPCYRSAPGPGLRSALASGAHGVLLDASSSSSIVPGIT